EGSKYKKNFKVKNDKGKFKKASSNNKSKNANEGCYHCGKKGRYIRDCRHRKASEKYANKTNDANMVEEYGVDIVAVLSMMHIGTITEVNMAAAKNPLIGGLILGLLSMFAMTKLNSRHMKHQWTIERF
ncbi:PREDICTED: Retrovirus-related Pol poly from transposon TNT 1-94, partial [Prunus dulcis]